VAEVAEAVDRFYPHRGAGPNSPRDELGHLAGSEAAAKALCRTCPVRACCLAAALIRPELHGIWGGLTERERRPLRRELLDQLAAGADDVDCEECA
jgi:Transcription factor WhiB